jgi:hypothetical protein
MEQRAPWCERALLSLDRFTDDDSVGKAGVYNTQKILIAERIVDCVVSPDAPDVAWLGARHEAIQMRVSADVATHAGHGGV